MYKKISAQIDELLPAPHERCRHWAPEWPPAISHLSKGAMKLPGFHWSLMMRWQRSTTKGSLLSPNGCTLPHSSCSHADITQIVSRTPCRHGMSISQIPFPTIIHQQNSSFKDQLFGGSGILSAATSPYYFWDAVWTHGSYERLANCCGPTLDTDSLSSARVFWRFSHSSPRPGRTRRIPTLRWIAYWIMMDIVNGC